MKRLVMIWIIYVCFAVVLLPAWLTAWMDGFEKEEKVEEIQMVFAWEEE